MHHQKETILSDKPIAMILRGLSRLSRKGQARAQKSPRQVLALPMVFSTVLLVIAFQGCGAPDSVEQCEIQFTLVNKTVGASQATATYRGAIGDDCQTIIRDTSGKVTLNLHGEAKASPDTYFSELKAGERQFTFDKNAHSFAGGTLDVRFDSQQSPQWQLPWQDKPSTIALVVKGSPDVADADLPAKLALTLTL